MSKEWLEDIKERFAKYQYDYNLNGEDVEWLIQQAERVEELEEDIKKIIKTADIIDERNQRYITALEKIVNQAGINKEIDLELWKMAREALEGKTE